ncbi:hypothetical protein FM102_11105 [Corynebacterium glutamicum]|nr:hypothetical protein FM102_11105 [Corynebacterium glutamicum]
MDDEFDGALFELVGLFDRRVRLSFSIFLPPIKLGVIHITENPDS